MTRDVKVDTIAGLLILVMIAGHCGVVGFGAYSIGQIFSFYMGWFFYKSGIYHTTKAYDKKNIIKLVKRLLIPFVIFTAYGIMINYFTALYLHQNLPSPIGYLKQLLNLGAITYNIPLWFLSSLFFVKIISFRIDSQNWYRWTLVGIVAAIIQNALFPPSLLPYLGNIPLGVAFYAVGFRLKEIHKKPHVGIICMLTYVFMNLALPSCINFFRNHTYFGNYYIAVLCILLGIIAVNWCFERICHYGFKLFSFFGRHSLEYLVVHYPIYLSINQLPPPARKFYEYGDITG